MTSCKLLAASLSSLPTANVILGINIISGVTSILDVQQVKF